MKYTDIINQTGQPGYKMAFWNAMRGNHTIMNEHGFKKDAESGMYLLPLETDQQFQKGLKRCSIFRNLATVIKAYDSYYRVIAKDSKDMTTWVAEGDEIPIRNVVGDFMAITTGSHKLASLVQVENDFVHDVGFDVVEYLLERFGRAFAKGEDDAFVNGDGENAPTGILCKGRGAEVALTTDALKYDDLTSLFYALDSEYRENATWLMNDETALAISMLTDNIGNPIWMEPDHLLGKPVRICNAMPSVAPGTLPIALGDFSYYWIILKRPFTMQMLSELFIKQDQIGYLAMESLDGVLMRPEAIKAIQITG